MNRILPYLLFVLLPAKCFSQLIDKKFEFITAGDSSFAILMQGKLDAENTFTWLDYESEQRYNIGFQPMKSISIINKGTTILKVPRIIINDRGRWYNPTDLNIEIFNGKKDFKEKYLSLWNFTLQNSIHRYYPEFGYKTGQPVKLFASYGYGQCFNLASMITMLPENTVEERYDLFSALHAVSEFSDRTNVAVFDGDLRTFYLNYDNLTLSSLLDVGMDRYLIKRTHHYGKQFKFDYGVNNYISQLYGINGIYSGKVNREAYSLNYSLRPGESLIYSWEEGMYKYTNWESDALTSEVGNCIFSFKVDSLNLDYPDSIFYTNYRTVVDRDSSGKYLLMPTDSSEIGIQLNYSFPLLNTELAFSVQSNSANDSLAVYISPDSTNWKSHTFYLDSGLNTLSYNFKDEIAEFSKTTPLDKGFIKVRALQDSSNIRIYQLNIRSICQVNRFFLPSLNLGENTVQYLQENENKSAVQISIEWQENFENSPPSNALTPIYPKDQEEIDDLQFEFSWESVLDPDGDEIVNYEFELSDREDMKYPLSPTFNVYTNSKPAFQFSGEVKSSINARQKESKKILLGNVRELRKLLSNEDYNNSRLLLKEINRFEVPFEGLLNSGQKYYWRVKAQDDKGNWGQWSPVWSFTPIGVMPPQNFEIEEVFDSLNSIKEISLKWEKNRSGTTPRYYEIHSSNEWLGFTPNDSTLLTTTQDTSLRVAISDTIHFCYRVIAVDSLDKRSGPSNYVSLKAPYALNQPDSLYLNEQFAFSLKLPKVWYPNLNIADYQSMAVNEDYTYTANCPSWLTFDPHTRTFSGMPDSDLFYDSLTNKNLIEISITGNLIRKTHKQLFIIPYKKFLLPGDSVFLEINDTLDVIVDTKENIFKEGFYVYPNPFHNKLLIDFDNEKYKLKAIEAEIFDLSGRSILKKSISKDWNQAYPYKMKFKNLPSGIYILKVISNNKSFITRIRSENPFN